MAQNAKTPKLSLRGFADIGINPGDAENLLLHEGPLDHIVAEVTMASFLEPHVIEDGAGVFQHAGTTAHHEPVIFQVKFRQVQVLVSLPFSIASVRRPVLRKSSRVTVG